MKSENNDNKMPGHMANIKNLGVNILKTAIVAGTLFYNGCATKLAERSLILSNSDVNEANIESAKEGYNSLSDADKKLAKKDINEQWKAKKKAEKAGSETVEAKGVDEPKKDGKCNIDTLPTADLEAVMENYKADKAVAGLYTELQSLNSARDKISQSPEMDGLTAQIKSYEKDIDATTTKIDAVDRKITAVDKVIADINSKVSDKVSVIRSDRDHFEDIYERSKNDQGKAKYKDTVDKKTTTIGIEAYRRLLKHIPGLEAAANIRGIYGPKDKELTVAFEKRMNIEVDEGIPAHEVGNTLIKSIDGRILADIEADRAADVQVETSKKSKLEVERSGYRTDVSGTENSKGKLETKRSGLQKRLEEENKDLYTENDKLRAGSLVNIADAYFKAFESENRLDVREGLLKSAQDYLDKAHDITSSKKLEDKLNAWNEIDASAYDIDCGPKLGQVKSTVFDSTKFREFVKQPGNAVTPFVAIKGGYDNKLVDSNLPTGNAETIINGGSMGVRGKMTIKDLIGIGGEFNRQWAGGVSNYKGKKVQEHEIDAREFGAEVSISKDSLKIGNALFGVDGTAYFSLKNNEEILTGNGLTQKLKKLTGSKAFTLGISLMGKNGKYQGMPVVAYMSEKVLKQSSDNGLTIDEVSTEDGAKVFAVSYGSKMQAGPVGMIFAPEYQRVKGEARDGEILQAYNAMGGYGAITFAIPKAGDISLDGMVLGRKGKGIEGNFNDNYTIGGGLAVPLGESGFFLYGTLQRDRQIESTDTDKTNRIDHVVGLELISTNPIYSIKRLIDNAKNRPEPKAQKQ